MVKKKITPENMGDIIEACLEFETFLPEVKKCVNKARRKLTEGITLLLTTDVSQLTEKKRRMHRKIANLMMGQLSALSGPAIVRRLIWKHGREGSVPPEWMNG